MDAFDDIYKEIATASKSISRDNELEVSEQLMNPATTMSEIANNNDSTDNGQHIKPKKSAKKNTAVTGEAKLPKTPTKKRAAPAADGASAKKARAVKKTYNPDSYEAFNDADKALYDLKTHHQDWKWAQIVDEYKQQTGSTASFDTIRKRWPVLEALAAQVKTGDIAKLATAKHEVERELEKEKWTKIAAKIKEDGGDDYSAGLLQKKYNQFVRDGTIDAQGKYNGEVVDDAGPQGSDDGEEQAQDEVKAEAGDGQ